MINTKRSSLESFIRTQMEGPGACNDRFIYLSDSPIIDVINTTPGSLYSTAILFPKKDFQNSQPIIEEIVNEDTLNDTLDITEDLVDSLETESEKETDIDFKEKTPILSLTEEEDLYALSQQFPNTIGISCCIDPNDNDIANNLIIKISGRYYTKISKENFNKICIKITENREKFNIFFAQYQETLNQYFQLNQEGLTLTNNNITAKDYPTIKQLLSTINIDVCSKIAKSENDNYDLLYLSMKEEHRFLKSYKEKLWSELKYVKKDGHPYKDNYRHKKVLTKIKDIELYETFLSYLEDVSNIIHSNSFGYWTAEKFEKEIDLTGINLNIISNKKVFSPNKYNNLKDIVSFNIEQKNENIDETDNASLSIWLQATRNSRQKDDHRIYLKIQLQNTSTPFREDSKCYFSIVTERVNQLSFFGTKIEVKSKLLVPYHSNSSSTDSDIENLNYIYRSIKDYGIGHLCSVDWITENGFTTIKSDFIPSHNTPDVEPMPRDKYSEYIQEGDNFVPKPILEDSKALEFKWLSNFSDATNDEIISKLLNFIDSYGLWISKLRTIDPDDKNAIVNLNLCEKDYMRMRSNVIMLLSQNAVNLGSFRLMNSAMFIQLWHSKHNTQEHITKDFYKKANDNLFNNSPATWRPFQMAFILLNLDGIFQRIDDPKWNARNELVDLVWFPTGGGKTEAYLGIIALSIINRRRVELKEKSLGTTAIMRYTLRLLATQQFQRAMRVILALEQLRRWPEFNLGDSPITIGLYVGKDSLPNNAKDLLEECRKWGRGDNETQIPLYNCPWCGNKIEFQDSGNSSSPKIHFRCSNIYCTFSTNLPVILCDEYIYNTPPTLLFGTVDKFASLGHKVSTKQPNKDSRRIFGGGGLNYLPPDLIIQDELHLLLGPLGSAVSLFESAIDQLCSFKKKSIDDTLITVRPKIISSTATTRNTDLQIMALYDRHVNIFPKCGIDYDDSFFAFYRRRKNNNNIEFISKRKYLGILPTGRTQITTQMRLTATILVHRAIFEKQHIDTLLENNTREAMDYYHSTILYFNSLKEVGRTDAQFFTEFTKYTRRLFKRVIRNSNMLECYYGYNSSFSKSELTGRLTGPEVIKQLDLVSQNWDSQKRLPYTDSDNKYNPGFTPPDIVLATNMISVGLDVSRFNSIIMNSMPKNIAEYIQASSRVAREKVGLVVTLHNPFQSRDLSHFEKFKEFHEKLYYYVEPISITPFSKKSIEKYLPLYIATIIRHKYENLADNNSANSLTQIDVLKLKKDLLYYFDNRLERTKNLNNNLSNIFTTELRDNIENFINKALDYWLELKTNGVEERYELHYTTSRFLNKNKEKRKNLFLDLSEYENDINHNLWAVPMALRNIETSAVIHINEKQ